MGRRRPLRELTPIEAERRRVEAEQNRRREAAKNAQRSIHDPQLAQHLNSYLVRIKNARAKVDAANDGYRPPESNVRLISAPHSWEASARVGTVQSASAAMHQHEPRTPEVPRPVPPASEPPGGRAPRRGTSRPQQEARGSDRARRAAAGSFDGIDVRS